LRGKVIGLPEYFAVDNAMYERKGEFAKAIDILLSHMERVDSYHVLVFYYTDKKQIAAYGSKMRATVYQKRFVSVEILISARLRRLRAV